MRREHWHIARAAVWVALAPVALLTSLKNSIAFVILLSLYANAAGDISSWQAARAERKVEESSS